MKKRTGYVILIAEQDKEGRVHWWIAAEGIDADLGGRIACIAYKALSGEVLMPVKTVGSPPPKVAMPRPRFRMMASASSVDSTWATLDTIPA